MNTIDTKHTEHKEKKKRLTTRLILTLILVIGMILGGVILKSNKPKPANDHGHDAKENISSKQPVTQTNEHHEAHDDHGHEDKLHAPPRLYPTEKISLSDAQIKAAGISIQTAGPARIKNSVQLAGEIRFNEDRTAHVVPRLSGVVQNVLVNLGQQVKKGQVLAVISSTQLSEQRSELLAAQKRLALAKTNYEREQKLWQEKVSAEQDYLQAKQALQEAEIAKQNASQKLAAIGATAAASGALNRFELRAPFNGMIVEKHIALGESIKEDTQIFTLSDLSTVWAEITVPAKDLNTVRVGEKAEINAISFNSSTTGTVSYVGALLGEQTRAAKARITLANPHMAWRPGLFVNVSLMSNESKTPIAVIADAVHSVNDKPTVFIKVSGGFMPQTVATGRSDGKWVEIVQGLTPNTPYAAANSFVLKADLGKGSAEHAH